MEDSSRSQKHFLGLTISPLQMAYGLGALAVLPFLLGVYYAYSHIPLNAARALTGLLAYLGIIIGFIGGVQWGRMLAVGKAPPQDMALAVLPAIIAWPGVLMSNPWWSFFILLAALILAWLIDEHGYRVGWQSWGFLQLRRLLSATVALCVIVVAWRVLRSGV